MQQNVFYIVKDLFSFLYLFVNYLRLETDVAISLRLKAITTIRVATMLHIGKLQLRFWSRVRIRVTYCNITLAQSLSFVQDM